jgi:predicted kinase
MVVLLTFRADCSLLAPKPAHSSRLLPAEVDVDDTKTQLYGPAIQDKDLGHDDWVRIYAETDSLIEHYLQAGRTVIDASRNFRKEERQLARQIASNLEAQVLTVICQLSCPPGTFYGLKGQRTLYGSPPL